MSDDKAWFEPAYTAITVNYTDNAVKALENILTRGPLPQTDVMNRAIQLYDYLDAAWTNGAKVYIQNPNGNVFLLSIW